MLCIPAAAQNRAIEGTVTDDQGQPLADVNITIHGLDNPRKLEVKTDKKGNYLYLLGLQSGNYRVVARKEGFQPVKEENVKPELRETLRVDFEMTPGPDRKFPFEMSPEEQKEYMKQYESRKKYEQYASEVKEHFDAGMGMMKEKKYEEALVEFNAALALDPEQPGVLAQSADAYKNLGKYEEALASIDKSIQFDPGNGNLYSNKGDILSKMGKTKESQEAFQKATDMNPEAGAQNLYNIGVTHYNEGRMEEASAFFRKAIESDGNYAEAYYLLATCLSGSMETIPEAIDLFNRYIDLGGKSENIEVAKAMVEALKSYAK